MNTPGEAVLTCNACGALNHANARFCMGCGTGLPPTSQAQHAGATDVTCAVCTAAMKVGAQYCPQCGAEARTATDGPSGHTSAGTADVVYTSQPGFGPSPATHSGSAVFSNRSNRIVLGAVAVLGGLTVLVLVILVVALASLEGRTQGTSPTSSSAPSIPSIIGGSGKLTNANAESTIRVWMKNGSVTVRGIQEFAQQNSATADLEMQNYNYNDDGRPLTYSGKAAAIFTHYNDGRWVLTKVILNPDTFDPDTFSNINVEVR